MTVMVNDVQESAEQVDDLERRFRANQLKMDLRLQEAQMTQLDRALALDASRRSFGSAGSQEVMEGLYAPEDYVDIADYRRENYGYQSYAATFTAKTDRQDGRNWPYWVSEPELAAIRGTVRLLAAYNKTCFGVLNKLRNYTVSKGFSRKVLSKRDAPKSLTATLETILDEFDSLNQITGGMDQEAVVRDIRDGEVALGLWHRGEGRVDLRVVEPDQISEPTNKHDLEDWLRTEQQMGIEGEESGLPFESNWSFGIHTTKGDVCNRHGFYVQWDGSPQNWDYLPGGNSPCYPPSGGVNTWLEFRKSNTDRNIKRGVSDFWPVTGDVELARKMIRNLTHAGALQAAIAWIREMSPGTTAAQVNSATMATADWQTQTTAASGGTRTTYQQTYQPGSTLYLGANQKFVPPPWVQQSMAAGLVGIFEAMLRSISQIWSMPEHMITGSAANNNYASILEAGSPFVKEIETRQNWHAVMWTAVYWKVVWFNWRAGRLPGYSWKNIRAAVEIVLTGPQVDVRDRMQDTQRNILLLHAGIVSPIEVASREGVDYDDQIRQGATVTPSSIGGREFGLIPSLPEVIPSAGEEGEQVTANDASQPQTKQVVQTASEFTLNGAQIQAALSIVTGVADGDMPRDAGVGQLQVLFNLSPQQAETIMGSAGTSVPTTPNPKPAAATQESVRNEQRAPGGFAALTAASSVDWGVYP